VIINVHSNNSAVSLQLTVQNVIGCDTIVFIQPILLCRLHYTFRLKSTEMKLRRRKSQTNYGTLKTKNPIINRHKRVMVPGVVLGPGRRRTCPQFSSRPHSFAAEVVFRVSRIPRRSKIAASFGHASAKKLFVHVGKTLTD